MSVEYESRKVINRLKESAEETTGESYNTLTEAHQALKNGYGQGAKEEMAKTITINENGLYYVYPDEGKVLSGVNVAVGVKCEEVKLESEITVDITENGTTELVPEEGETFSKVTVNVDVPSSGGGNDSSFKSFIERTEKTPTLPSDLTKIGSYAFYNYSTLAITSLPSGITDIGAYAFMGCSNIALTALPNGVKTIGGNAFQGCSKLALTSLPSELTSIGNGGFQNCSNIAITSLPSGLTSIGNAAFRSCTNLKTITFNSTPTSALGTAVFYDCSNLTDIYVPWAEGEVANAPWGATNATIHYNSEV